MVRAGAPLRRAKVGIRADSQLCAALMAPFSQPIRADMLADGQRSKLDEGIMRSGLRRAAYHRVIGIGALAAVGWLGAGSAGAQLPQNRPIPESSSQDRVWCENRQRTFAADLRINGCTALIESGNLTRSDLAVSYNNRGAAYQERHDLDHAIADYDEAIKLHPAYAPAYNNRGNAHQAKGDIDAAIADYSDAIRFDFNFVQAFNNRGKAYQMKGDIDRAIADYNAAINLNPNFALAFVNHGDANLLKGDLNRALADYNEGIRLDARSASAFNNRGTAYGRKGDLEHALTDFDEAIRLDPT
jgi:tetratricopeptide (TPR) repeat protein